MSNRLVQMNISINYGNTPYVYIILFSSITQQASLVTSLLASKILINTVCPRR